ncbi:MAG: LuxR C-terminal-related transcriptional regulator, partial [Chlamydiia bacterium]
MPSWDEIVERYIVRHSDPIRKATAPIRQHLGVDYFTYHRIQADGRYIVLVDRPDWAERYVGDQIYLHDPYLRHPDVYTSGMCYVESFGSAAYQKVLEAPVAEIFGATSNVLLIQKQKEAVEFFGFSGRKGSVWERTFFNQPGQLKAFGSYFKQQMRPILQEVEADPGFLPILKGGDFFSTEAIHPTATKQAQSAYLSSIGHHHDVAQASLLSPRERDVLQALLKGHSSKESADQLQLSSRTVEFYLGNVKNKLGCLNRAELLQRSQTFSDL